MMSCLRNYLVLVALLGLFSTVSSFTLPQNNAKVPSSTALNEVQFADRVTELFAGAPKPTQYDVMIKLTFPGALNYDQLESRIRRITGAKGYTPENTLLATSLCCDELARTMEKDLVKVYGNNFHLGGLAGFPFAGSTGFGA
jgi:hypothetical protein